MPTSIKNFINNYITKKRLVATRNKCSCSFHLDIGCIDNGPKMAKIEIELCYFTYVFRGIIQGIE